MTTAIVHRWSVRRLAWLITVIAAGTTAVACGSSPTGNYFAASDPIFDRHSRAITAAETRMFKVTESDLTGVFEFGGTARNASALLPIFRETAAAVEADIAEWDAIDVPVVTSEYHALVRDAMVRRLDAMRDSVAALEVINAGVTAGDAFDEAEEALEDAEQAMELANLALIEALDEERRIRGLNPPGG